MKTSRNLILAVFGALTLVVVFSASGAGRARSIVDIASKEGVGSYLVDPNGMTLYQFKNDSKNTSVCTGECAAMWPAFYSRNIIVPHGLKASDFGAITRDDGKQQTTYKGLPLYRFSGDAKPGDVNGNGAYNLWFPATP